ncbi:MAG: trigger factor [Gammaproteobacteria bacterium]|nr:MAG: trigger factor [Gammaproteobacteria bacterium]
MHVSVEAGEGLERRIRGEIPPEQIEEAVQKRLKSLAKRTRIAGFRPGKVPLSVIRQRFGKQARKEAIAELVQSSLFEAIQRESLRIAGAPQVEAHPESSSKGVAYEAVVEVLPEITLASLEGFTVEKPVAEVTEEDVDRVLEVLRKQRTQWVEVDRPAQEGDRVTFDYKATIDGEPFEGSEAQGVKVVLGSGELLPSFDENLLGVKAGETRTFKVAFPEDYGIKEVAGKEAEFTVQVKAVEEPKLPELDDEFAKSFGIQEGGLQALRQEVRETLEKELKRAIEKKVKEQVMDILLKAHPIELPKAMVQEEVQRMMAQLKEQLPKTSLKDLDPSLFEEAARRRVALGLIVGEIAKREGMTPDPERVRAEIENIASSYEQPEEVMQWIYSNRQQLADIEAKVLEDQVMEWVLQHVQVKEVPTTFDALVRKQEEETS